MLIGGKLTGAQSGRTFVSINPATGEHLAEVPEANENDVANGVEAARKAFRGWWATGPGERAQRLRLLSRRLQEKSEEYAMLDARDAGNPVASMRTDVANAAKSLEYFAGLAGELKGDTMCPAPNVLTQTVREPFGVVARIIPTAAVTTWDFRLAAISRAASAGRNRWRNCSVIRKSKA